MHLIIAEKPSLQKNIIASLGANSFTRYDGYSENDNYIVTCAFGHLFELKSIEAYHPNYDPAEKPRWSLDALPFCPESFQYCLHQNRKTRKTDPGIRTRFTLIRKLIARRDVDCIIHAGDSDREGEIIIRILLDQAGNTKPVYRLWLPEQTADSILAGLSHLEQDANYDALAHEGYARSYIDWLYGINLTRLATLKSGSLLRVGRVIVPIVQAIYNRDMAIRNFVPTQYWALSSKAQTKGHVLELTSKQQFDVKVRSQAAATCERYNQAGATVTQVKREEKQVGPGKLYSLSKLQGVLGKKYKMTPTESLSTIQSLYEAGYVTYPRTNTEYLARAEAGKINAILDKLIALGYHVRHKDGDKAIYDDSKIESHSALTPTSKLARQDSLSEREWLVYSTILNRFLAVFCSEPCTVDRTTMTIEINGGLETFTLSGDVLISQGWMQYDATGRSDKTLPDLAAGDAVVLDFKPVPKETVPPKHYTVDSLSKYLQNPFKKQRDTEENGSDDAESADDHQDYKAMLDGVEIGTEATRTSIIQNAIDSGYIALKNNSYSILPGGEYLIHCLKQLDIHMEPEKTAKLGQLLKRVYRGETTVDESVSHAFREVQACFAGSKGVSIPTSPPPKKQGRSSPASLGRCPRNCGGEVVSQAKGYFCSNRDCDFAIWKDDKFFAAIGKKLTPAMVKALLGKGRINLKGCTSKKTGKSFDCSVTADFSQKYPHYTMSFERNRKSNGK